MYAKITKNNCKNSVCHLIDNFSCNNIRRLLSHHINIGLRTQTCATLTTKSGPFNQLISTFLTKHYYILIAKTSKCRNNFFASLCFAVI